jgi:hypothetical protein
VAIPGFGCGGGGWFVGVRAGVWRCAGWIAAGAVGWVIVLNDSCETGAAITGMKGVRAGRVFRCVWAQGHNNTRPEWAVGCEDMKWMTPRPLHTRNKFRGIPVSYHSTSYDFFPNSSTNCFGVLTLCGTFQIYCPTLAKLRALLIISHVLA